MSLSYIYPVIQNKYKNWQNALNQEDMGNLHAVPMSGGVTPLVVGCRGRRSYVYIDIDSWGVVVR